MGVGDGGWGRGVGVGSRCWGQLGGWGHGG